jgi:endogenous inhibitor of DNA gyrase (YacG/DUF329 family)
MLKVRCPVCDREMEGAGRSEWPDAPFCSARCRLIDLGRWLGERYVIRPEKETEDPAQSDDEYSIP